MLSLIRKFWRYRELWAGNCEPGTVSQELWRKTKYTWEIYIYIYKTRYISYKSLYCHSCWWWIPNPKWCEMAEHTAILDMGQIKLTSVYWSHVLTALGRRTLHARQGHRRVAPENRLNNQGLWDTDFVLSRWDASDSRGPLEQFCQLAGNQSLLGWRLECNLRDWWKNWLDRAPFSLGVGISGETRKTHSEVLGALSVSNMLRQHLKCSYNASQVRKESEQIKTQTSTVRTRNTS